MAANKSIREVLAPDENILDELRVQGCDLVLTGRRVLASGSTNCLGPQYTLLRGSMVTSFPLPQFESYIVGTGKRPWLLLLSLSIAVAAVIMYFVPPARYAALVAAGVALFFFLGWTVWTRTFVSVYGGGVKISGQARRREAVVFLERVQLAARAAREGGSDKDVAKAVQLAGRVPSDETAEKASASSQGE
ncbi:MAG: hypothetical protein R6V10_08400 [bacterium]